jgi:hypothetical protein
MKQTKGRQEVNEAKKKDFIHMRVEGRQKNLWKEACKDEGEEFLSQWITKVLNLYTTTDCV